MSCSSSEAESSEGGVLGRFVRCLCDIAALFSFLVDPGFGC